MQRHNSSVATLNLSRAKNKPSEPSHNPESLLQLFQETLQLFASFRWGSLGGNKAAEPGGVKVEKKNVEPYPVIRFQNKLRGCYVHRMSEGGGSEMGHSSDMVLLLWFEVAK